MLDSSSHVWHRLWEWQWPLMLMSGLSLLYVSEWTRVDMALQDWIYDPQFHGFPLKDHWLLQTVLHDWVKNGAVVLWLALLVARLWSKRWPWVFECRQAISYLLVSSASITLFVAWLKHHTGKFCPWDLQRYGGDQAFVGLFEQAEHASLEGQCWPGGHVSTAFAFVGIYYALRVCHRPWARPALLGVLALGAVLAVAQTLRGAHFLSHNLWTVWFSWVLAWLWTMVFHLDWKNSRNSE